MTLDQVVNTLHSTVFLLGLLIGLVVGFFFWLYGSVLRQRYYYQCAIGKTAAKIGHEFYYIVAEREYVQSDLNYPKRERKTGTLTLP